MIEKPKFDLEERTQIFSENLIKMCKLVQRNNVSDPIVNQLIRSGTSIGANYSEANGASSKKDFKSKINISKKEARETQYWLRNLATAIDDPIIKEKCRELWKEARELTLIFSTIALNTK